MTMNIKYDIPKDYFESLPDKIMDRINFEQSSPNRGKMRILKFITYAAAVFIGFGIFYIEVLEKSANKENKEIENSDFWEDYQNDLATKNTDVKVLYYTEEDKLASDKSNLIEIMNEYPSPITFYENYDY